MMCIGMIDRVTDRFLQAVHIGLVGPEKAWHWRVGVRRVVAGSICSTKSCDLSMPSNAAV